MLHGRKGKKNISHPFFFYWRYCFGLSCVQVFKATGTSCRNSFINQAVNESGYRSQPIY